MCIDDFDLGQVDDCGDGYFNDLDESMFNEEILKATANGIIRTNHPAHGAPRPLTKEDYADIFLENFD